jgi:hypothetical protein
VRLRFFFVQSNNVLLVVVSTFTADFAEAQLLDDASAGGCWLAPFGYFTMSFCSGQVKMLAARLVPYRLCLARLGATIAPVCPSLVLI